MLKSLGERIRKIERKRWMVIGAVLGVVLLGFLLIRGLAARGRAAQTADLQTALVERGALTATIGATGSVRAIQSAILSWQTTGTVEKVNVQIGDKVGQDEVLANLELTSLPQNVILAQNDLEAAQDELENFYNSYDDLGIAEAQKALADAQDAMEDAQRNLNAVSQPARQVDIDRAFANMILAKNALEKAQKNYAPYANKPDTNLVRANMLVKLSEAQQTYDSAVWTYNAYTGTGNPTAIAQAEAQLALAQAQLDQARKDYDEVSGGPTSEALAAAQGRVAAAQATLNLARLAAPFAGVVTDAYPHEGDLVSQGVVAFQIDNLDHLLVDVDVSEVDINKLGVSQPAIITFDAAPEKEYHGEVVSVALAGVVKQGAVNFRVTVELKDADEFVRPGMTAGVNIVVTELQDVLLVPNRAVRVEEGQRVVYILREGKMEPVVITLGASSETVSEVLAGDLHEGDMIVLNPPSFTFEPGQPPPGGGQFFGPGN